MKYSLGIALGLVALLCGCSHTKNDAEAVADVAPRSPQYLMSAPAPLQESPDADDEAATADVIPGPRPYTESIVAPLSPAHLPRRFTPEGGQPAACQRPPRQPCAPQRGVPQRCYRGAGRGRMAAGDNHSGGPGPLPAADGRVGWFGHRGRKKANYRRCDGPARRRSRPPRHQARRRKALHRPAGPAPAKSAKY